MRGKMFDVNRRYVRVVDKRPDGLIEFEFSIGEPEMMAELVMPHDAFDAFCEHNQVTFLEHLPSPDTEAQEANEWAWRLHDATHRRFRRSA